MTVRGSWLLLLVLLGGGCAGVGDVSEAQRLQARAAYEAGTAAMHQRQFAQALTSLRQANLLDPNVPMYRNDLARVLLILGRPDLALTEARRAIELDPDYADAHINAGIALAEQRQWNEAVVEYEKAIRSPRLFTPDIAYQNLGIALFNLQRYAEAEGALRFAINLDSQMDSAWYHLGLVLLASKRTAEARQAFQRARELGPNSPFGQAAAERLKAMGDGG
jgi:Tfp pilus assembly protein PilF